MAPPPRKWYKNALHWAKPVIFNGYRKPVAIFDNVSPLPVHLETLRILEAGEEIPLRARSYFRSCKSSQVPLLPGYFMISKVNDHFVRLNFVIFKDGLIGLELARFTSQFSDPASLVESQTTDIEDGWASAVLAFTHADPASKMSSLRTLGFEDPQVVSELRTSALITRSSALVTPTVEPLPQHGPACASLQTKMKLTMVLRYIVTQIHSP